MEGVQNNTSDPRIYSERAQGIRKKELEVVKHKRSFKFLAALDVF